MAGLVKRRLYKPERRPARKHGVFGKALEYANAKFKPKVDPFAPVGLPDASAGEVRKALFAMCQSAGVVVGQGSGYEALRDEYHVIGKSMATGKAQDFKIAGAEVAELIRVARMLNGGPMVATGNPR